MGSSKGSSSTQVQLTPEQSRVLGIQADALESTFMPAYKNTISGAGSALAQTSPAALQAAQTGMDVAGQTGALQQGYGSANLAMGSQGLASLFGSDYKEQQVQGALQAGREATREQLAGQNAMYGAAGALGSSRQALADKNLEQLGEQRQATAAASAAAGVEANRAAASQALMGGGQSQLAAANQAAAARIGYAQTPQDIFAKYASIVYGTPQGSTTPNFGGTQGQTQQGSSKGFKI